MSLDYETKIMFTDSLDRSLIIRVNGIGVYFDTSDGEMGEVGISFKDFHQIFNHVKGLVPAPSKEGD